MTNQLNKLHLHAHLLLYFKSIVKLWNLADVLCKSQFKNVHLFENFSLLKKYEENNIYICSLR